MSIKPVRIGNFLVGPGQPTFIIAEIGINHNGDINIAKDLIRQAKMRGADAVKFQKRTVGVVYTPEELAKPREVLKDLLQKAIERGVLSDEASQRLWKSDFSDSTNGDLKRALELTVGEYWEINKFCQEIGIMWFASPWDEDSVDFLDQFDVPCHKIASASITDVDLLEHIRSSGRPIIMSTGMADLEIIRQAVKVIGTDDLILMHCTSYYPTHMVTPGDHGLRLLNLKGIETLANDLNVPIGFSSHDTGIMPTYASVAMGACTIEKHLTLYRGMWGSDQAASIEPRQLEDLCRMVRELEVARGDGIIRFYDEERPVAAKLRRVDTLTPA